jgi:hypothetical protein
MQLKGFFVVALQIKNQIIIFLEAGGHLFLISRLCKKVFTTIHPPTYSSMHLTVYGVKYSTKAQPQCMEHIFVFAFQINPKYLLFLEPRGCKFALKP